MIEVWQVVCSVPENRDEEKLISAITVFKIKLGIAQAQLKHHAFLVGDDLTLADIQFGHILYRYFELEIDRSDLPSIRRYYDQLTAMTHYRTHAMVNFKSYARKKAFHRITDA